MIFQLFLLSAVYLVLLLLIVPILRRRNTLLIPRRVIVPAVVLTLFLAGLHFLNLLPGPASPDSTPTEIVLWMTLTILMVMCLNQLVIGILAELLIRPGYLKIPKFVLNLLGGLFLALVFLFVLNFVFGQELSGILLTSTVASAIIGFSIQDTLSNLFAGIALQIESPFAIDDWVEIGGHEGQILSQNWRTLMLLTRENHRVSLTNQFVASDKIVNYSRPSKRQIQIFYIGLHYKHPPNFVKQVMIDFLNSVDECEYDPENPPFVAGFDEYAINYGLRFWIKDYADVIKVRDLVHTRLWYIFKREGIQIPYPIAYEIQQELPPHIVEAENKPEFDIPELLRTFDLLQKLDENQIEQLATSAKMQYYSADETLVKEGQSGDSMYLITRGTIDVSIKGNLNQDIHVQQKSAGDFFGEMSLLTGEPRSATIKAASDVYAIVLKKDAFTSVLMEDPSILTILLDELESQRQNIETSRLSQSNQAQAASISARDLLMGRIRDYLGLG